MVREQSIAVPLRFFLHRPTADNLVRTADHRGQERSGERMIHSPPHRYGFQVPGTLLAPAHVDRSRAGGAGTTDIDWIGARAEGNPCQHERDRQYCQQPLHQTTSLPFRRRHRCRQQRFFLVPEDPRHATSRYGFLISPTANASRPASTTATPLPTGGIPTRRPLRTAAAHARVDGSPCDDLTAQRCEPTGGSIQSRPNTERTYYLILRFVEEGAACQGMRNG